MHGPFRACTAPPGRTGPLRPRRFPAVPSRPAASRGAAATPVSVPVAAGAGPQLAAARGGEVAAGCLPPAQPLRICQIPGIAFPGEGGGREVLRLVYSEISHPRGPPAVFSIKVTPSCCRVREVCTVVKLGGFFIIIFKLDLFFGPRSCPRSQCSRSFAVQKKTTCGCSPVHREMYANTFCYF